MATLGTKEEGTTKDGSEKLLDNEHASQYGAVSARCNYLALDWPDIADSVKELARSMANPTEGDWMKLKRFGRYLKGRPRLQQTYAWQEARQIIRTYSDADLAGCKRTRKSTTGGCIKVGAHTIKAWSKTQSLVALSSAESEFYAILKASAETPGVMAMMHDIGYTVKGEIWGDASAILGIIHRHGLGKTRHIDTSLLWAQQVAATQRLKYGKMLGKDNPADLFTKYFDVSTIDHHIESLRFEDKEGRVGEAPKLHNLSCSLDE